MELAIWRRWLAPLLLYAQPEILRVNENEQWESHDGHHRSEKISDQSV